MRCDLIKVSLSSRSIDLTSVLHSYTFIIYATRSMYCYLVIYVCMYTTKFMYTTGEIRSAQIFYLLIYISGRKATCSSEGRKGGRGGGPPGPRGQYTMHKPGRFYRIYNAGDLTE